MNFCGDSFPNTEHSHHHHRHHHHHNYHHNHHHHHHHHELTGRTLVPEVVVEGLDGLDILARGVGHLALDVGGPVGADVVAHAAGVAAAAAAECLISTTTTVLLPLTQRAAVTTQTPAGSKEWPRLVLGADLYTALHFVRR